MPSFTINFNSEREKRDLWNYLKTLKGVYQIKTQKSRKYEGRYKYYFGHVLAVIEEKEIYVSEEGEVLSGRDLHEALKIIYNPMRVLQPVQGRIYIEGKSTTGMSDWEFINEYEQQIISDHSQEPHYMNFIDRKTWTEMKIHEYENRNNKLIINTKYNNKDGNTKIESKKGRNHKRETDVPQKQKS